MSKYRYMRETSVTALCVFIASSFPAVASAQDSLNNNQDIIVTAQGREQSLQDVPVAVSVVSGDTLVKQGITSLQDLSARVGNVKITKGAQVNSINVRGVGSGENAGFEQAVATFADGVYRSRSKSTFAALFDVERVELLKGPQTTFFGANASAGALSITTKKPGDHFEYNASALYGFSDGEYDVQGGVSIPVSDDLGIRVAGRLSGMEGYVKMEPRGKGPNEDSQQGRVSLRWTPGSNWTTDIRVDYARTRATDNFPFQLLNCPAAGFPANSNACNAILANSPGIEDRLDYHSDGNRGTYMDFDFFESAMTNSLNLGFANLRSITAYSDMTVNSRVSLVPARFPATVAGSDPFPVESREKYKFFSQEIRLESEAGGTLEYMVGAYYSHGKLGYSGPSSFNFLPLDFLTESVFNVNWPDLAPDRVMTGIPALRQKEDMYSAFASATIRPVQAVRINMGLRYTKVKKEGHRSLPWGTTLNGVTDTFIPFSDAPQLITVGADNFGNPIQMPATRTQTICMILGCDTVDFTPTKRNDDKFMPSVGVQFDASDDVMLYGTYSKGFKAGGFSSTASASVFGPESVDAYEIGMKSQLFNRALSLNIALFRMDYKGLQETTFDANLSSDITNVAGARSQGVEVGAALRINDYVQMTADVAYLDATYKNYANGECTKLQTANGSCAANGGIQDLSGKNRAYAPEWSGSVGFDMRIPNGSYEFRVNPVMNFSSSYFMTATSDPLLKQSRYQKYDLRLSYGPENGPWEIAVIGRNLTNVATSSYRLGVPGGDGSVTALVERGRSVGVQFSIRN
ncbi:MAG: TonB-dependent receptor [Sphingobium sp.]|nr:TonB-dependent receptor [Sphingobium sp.]